MRSWGPTTGEARCGLLGHLLADQSHSLGALPIRDVGYQDVIVTGGTAGVASKHASARRPTQGGRGGLKLITTVSYLVSVRLIGEIMSREGEESDCCFCLLSLVDRFSVAGSCQVVCTR